VKGGINDLGHLDAGHTYWDGSHTSDIGIAGFDINNSDKIVGAGQMLWDHGTPTDMNIGNPGFTIAAGNAINDKNQVVGVGQTSDGQWRGFVWENGITTVLGMLGGNYSDAYDINNSGQVVGTATDSSGNYHPVIWTLPSGRKIKYDCKQEGWRVFLNLFKNQGQCIKAVKS
jgi:probable HAF family extracellular repeat protein